jgi:hypothetical protein
LRYNFFYCKVEHSICTYISCSFRDLDLKTFSISDCLQQVKLKYDIRMTTFHVTWQLHEKREFLTDEVKALVRAMEKKKVAPPGENDAACITRKRRLTSMEEALAFCKAAVLACSEWEPDLREHVWNLILVGVKANHMFHYYGVIRDDVLERANERLFIVEGQDLNDVAVLFLDDLPNFGK